MRDKLSPFEPWQQLMKPAAWLASLAVTSATPLGAAAPPAKPSQPPKVARVPVETSVVQGSASTPSRAVLTVGGERLALGFATSGEADSCARTLARRLAKVLTSYESLQQLEASPQGGGCALKAHGLTLWVITPRNAAGSGKSPAELVGSWVKAAQERGRKPGWPDELVDELEVAVGSRNVVPLPLALHGCKVEQPDAQDLQVNLNSDKTCLVLKGETPCTAQVRLTSESSQATLLIKVCEPAGTLPATVQVDVTGSPDRDFISEVLQQSVRQVTRNHRGASPTTYFAGAGGDEVRATVWLEGPGLWPVARNVQWNLGHLTASPSPPRALVASNEPELLVEDGILLDQDVGDKPCTYYYHHQNARDAAPRTLEVRLENPDAKPADVLVTHSGAGPSSDELYAGHVATYRYLGWKAGRCAWTVHLPPHGSYVLDSRELSQHTVACGLGQLEVLRGASPHLVVEAATSHLQDAEQGTALVAAPPRKGQPRGRGLFGEPKVHLDASYQAGQGYTFIPIGGPPYQQPLGPGTPNTGNYGVEHEVVIHLSNPTPETARAYLVFAVGGGVARGSLIVDDHLIETPVLSTRPSRPREHGLSSYTLDPGASRDVRVLAFPEPGSNYPVRLIVKPLPANQ